MEPYYAALIQLRKLVEQYRMDQRNLDTKRMNVEIVDDIDTNHIDTMVDYESSLNLKDNWKMTIELVMDNNKESIEATKENLV